MKAFSSTQRVARYYRTLLGETSSDESEEVDARVFPDGVEPAFVHVKLGLTLNVDNYESVRLDVAMTVPCVVEEADDAYAYAHQWCAERVSATRDEIRKSHSKE